MNWVPDACTPPVAERPLGLRESTALFDDALRPPARSGPTAPTPFSRPSEGAIGDPTSRGTSRCSFSTFTVDRDDDRIEVGATVPEGRTEVLDGLTALGSGAA